MWLRIVAAGMSQQECRRALRLNLKVKVQMALQVSKRDGFLCGLIGAGPRAGRREEERD